MSAPPAAGGDKKNIVKMAYIYFQEGRWDKAIEEYKKLIAMDPEDINTLNMLGDVYVKKGSVREAFEAYNKVSNDFSARGQIDKAAIVNKKIAVLDAATLPPEAQKKQNLIKQTFRAESAMEGSDMDGAIEAFNEVLKLDPENLGAFSKLAELFEKKGRTDEAVKQYQMLGLVFLKNRLYKKAQEMFQKVVQLEPVNVEAHNSLAQIYVKQGSESDAKKEYLNAAEQALAVGDLEKANVFAAKAVEFKSIEAHYVLGVVLFKKQKLSEAKAEFESLLRFKVNHAGALTHLGRVLLEMGQADKAAESIQKALKVEKDSPAALEAWAEVCVKKGNKSEANAALMSLTEKFAAAGDLDKAAEFARNAISLDENAVQPLVKLAEIVRQAGDKPGAAETFFKLGLLYEKQNKAELAAEAFKRTLEMNPSHPEAQKRVLGSVAPPAAAPAKAPEPAASAPSPAKASPAGVLDLEQEITAPPFGAAKIQAPAAPAPAPAAATAPPAEKPQPVREEPDPEEELRAQTTIADNYIKQGLVEEAIEIYQQLIEDHPQRPELKQKLNQAYTAYVKTGEDVIGALEAEKKAKEEEEQHLRLEMEKKAQEETKRLRLEMEQKARLEAEKRVRSELEKKAREEAETKAQEEMEALARQEKERKSKEEMEKRAKEEMEKRLRDESEKHAREQALQKAKEEAEKTIRAEMERKAKESARKPAPAMGDFTTSRTPPPSKGDSLEDGRDDFMTIAVADIYVRQGLHEEALKIYRRIVQLEPDNLEARKKAADLESLIKSKGGKVAPETSAPPSPPSNPAPPHPTHPPDEKDSGGKKKSNRVGYV